MVQEMITKLPILKLFALALVAWVVLVGERGQSGERGRNGVGTGSGCNWLTNYSCEKRKQTGSALKT
jgi:hypothetical protein